jgi:hypothetical protein
MTFSLVLKLLWGGGGLQPHWAWNPLDCTSVSVMFVLQYLVFNGNQSLTRGFLKLDLFYSLMLQLITLLDSSLLVCESQSCNRCPGFAMVVTVLFFTSGSQLTRARARTRLSYRLPGLAHSNKPHTDRFCNFSSVPYNWGIVRFSVGKFQKIRGPNGATNTAHADHS